MNAAMFHPIRIAAILAVASPLALLLFAGAFAASGHQESARTIYRDLRYLLLAELACVLIMAFAGAIYQSASTARELRSYHPPGKLVDVGGYRLHLYCSGKGGPTVVLDYGLAGSYLDWFYVQPEVANFTRVCSYDRAGYGWSDASSKPRLPESMAEELHTLLKNGGETSPYILVGHSFGAFNALAFAKLFARETAAVIFVDGSHPDVALPFRTQDKLWLRMMQLTMPFGLPRWRKWCGDGPLDFRGVKTAITCRSQAQKTYYEQWRAFAKCAEQIRALDTLGDVPIAVIARDPNRDNVNRSREERWQSLQRQFMKYSKNATYVVAPGSGHSVPSQRPDIIVDVIRKMVEQMRSGIARDEAGPIHH